MATSTSSTTSSTKSKQQLQSQQGAFPMRLHKMLNAVEKEGLTHIVSWRPHGRAFLVHDRDLFTVHVLPRFFKQTRFPSFQRQLNIYAFGRITRGKDQGSYHHPSFLRGQEELSLSIQRIQCKNIGKGRHHRPISSEPDFYSEESNGQKQPAPMIPNTASAQSAPVVGGQSVQPQTQPQQLLPAALGSYPFNLMGFAAPTAQAPTPQANFNLNPAALLGAAAAQQVPGTGNSNNDFLQALSLLQSAAAGNNAAPAPAAPASNNFAFQQQHQQQQPNPPASNNNAGAAQDPSVPLLMQLLVQVMQGNQANGNAAAPAPSPPVQTAQQLSQSALLQGLLNSQGSQPQQTASFQRPASQDAQLQNLVQSLLAEQQGGKNQATSSANQ